MWLLVLEAGFALFLLVFIVWWTMYSGPKASDVEQNEQKKAEGDKADRG